MADVLKSFLRALPKEDPFHEVAQENPFITKMIENGYTGRKGKGGFYRINREGEKRTLESINLKTGEYSPSQKFDLRINDKLNFKKLIFRKDKFGDYAWSVISKIILYASSLIPHVTKDHNNIDEAMLLGFNWTKGPFEILQDIGIKNGKIVEIGKIDSKSSRDTFDAKNLTVLPGCIDTQVHFREPGSTDTEDLHSGSRAAVAGGITAVFEMRNTNPPTSNKKEFQKKLDLAKNRMYCNYAFYFGATPDNTNELADLKNLEGCCGIKLFVGSSTGNLLVQHEGDIEKVFKNSSKVVAVHSEDQEI